MQSRTQLILQQLGIQQWLPRQQSSIASSVAMLWRDQDLSQPAQQHGRKVDAHSAEQQGQLAKPSSVARVLAAPPQASVPVPATERVRSEPVDELPATTALKALTYSLRLDYQVLQHEQFVILAAVQNSKELQLLQNIALCCTASLQSLTWPLAIESWDMHDLLLESYLNGFFYQQQQKTLIILGECSVAADQLGFAEWQAAAGLAQLLVSAEAKSVLWNTLYPYLY